MFEFPCPFPARSPQSHVPNGKGYPKMFKAVHDAMGEDAFAVYELVTHLLLGWPM